MRARLTSTAVAALAAAAVLTGPASGRHTASFQINVTAKEFSFHLGRGGVPHGTKVVFHLINNGTKPHAFTVGGKTSPSVKPHQSADLIVSFLKKGKFPYSWRGAARASGYFTVA